MFGNAWLGIVSSILQQKEFIVLIVNCSNVLASRISVSIPFAATYPYPSLPLSLLTHSTLFWNIRQGVAVSWGPAYLPPSTLHSFLFSLSMTLSFPNWNTWVSRGRSQRAGFPTLVSSPNWSKGSHSMTLGPGCLKPHCPMRKFPPWAKGTTILRS